jgi:hypothetical protein
MKYLYPAYQISNSHTHLGLSKSVVQHCYLSLTALHFLSHCIALSLSLLLYCSLSHSLTVLLSLYYSLCTAISALLSLHCSSLSVLAGRFADRTGYVASLYLFFTCRGYPYTCLTFLRRCLYIADTCIALAGSLVPFNSAMSALEPINLYAINQIAFKTQRHALMNAFFPAMSNCSTSRY